MTYGSIAYDLSYLGSTAVEERVRTRGPAARARSCPGTGRAQERTRVRVREKQAVAPLSVIGFLAVGIFAVVLLLSYVQLMGLSDHVVSNAQRARAASEGRIPASGPLRSGVRAERSRRGRHVHGPYEPAGRDQIVYTTCPGRTARRSIPPRAILDKGLSLLRAVVAQVALAVENFR